MGLKIVANNDSFIVEVSDGGSTDRRRVRRTTTNFCSQVIAVLGKEKHTDGSLSVVAIPDKLWSSRRRAQ